MSVIYDNTTMIMPFLTVNDCRKAVAFYVNALGATELKSYPNSANGYMSKMTMNNSEFWVGDEEAENGNFSPVGNSHTSVRIVLRTKDADDIFSKAINLGATEICPMTTEDNWRIGKLRDPFGHIWEIGYILED